MAYNNTTPGIYKIPYWARGERASDQSNLRISQIIENQLTGDSKLLGDNGVLQEGTYAGVFSSGASIVTLSAVGDTPALEALVAAKYVNQTTSLQWTGLPNSSTIYLYAQTVEQNIYLNGQLSTLQGKVVVAVWNTSGATPTEALLLAKATTTTSGISVDSSASITDNGDYINGKPYFVSLADHRTRIPIDHPDLSITREKYANNSIPSRAIGVWDGLTAGTDTLSGTGIATGHIKDGAITPQKMNFSTSGLQIASLTLASGLDVYGPTILRGTSTLYGPINLVGPITSGLNVYGDSLLRGTLTVQSGVTARSLLVQGASKHVSGLEVYNQALFRGNVVIQGLLVASGLTSGGGGTVVSGSTRFMNTIIANDTSYSGTEAFADAYNAVRQIATSDRPMPILVGFGNFSGIDLSTAKGGGSWNSNVSIVGLSTTGSIIQLLQGKTIAIDLAAQDVRINTIDTSSNTENAFGGAVTIAGRNLIVDQLNAHFYQLEDAVGTDNHGGTVTITGEGVTVGTLDASSFTNGIDAGSGADTAFGGDVTLSASPLVASIVNLSSISNGAGGQAGILQISNAEIGRVLMGEAPNYLWSKDSKIGTIGQHAVDALQGSNTYVNNTTFKAQGTAVDCIHNLVGGVANFYNVSMAAQGTNCRSITSSAPATVRCFGFLHSGGFTSGVTVTEGADELITNFFILP